MSFERLEVVVPELPLGLGEGLFEGVNLCVDVGSAVGRLGSGNVGMVAREVLGVVAHYRHFFWERRGVYTTFFVYWTHTKVPEWVGGGVDLLREILSAVPCVYVVESSVGDVLVFARWMAQSERFGGGTGAPTIVLSCAANGERCGMHAEESLRAPLYMLTMEGDSARFFACTKQEREVWTPPDFATAEWPCVEQADVDADPDTVSTRIATLLGPTDIPIGHLFDGVDQWG